MLKVSHHFSSNIYFSELHPEAIGLKITIPKEHDKHPKPIFEKEFVKLWEEFAVEGEKYHSNFKIKIQWYSDDKDELLQEFHKLHEGTTSLLIIILTMLESTNSNDFDKRKDQFYEKYNRLKISYDKFTTKLVNLGIKDVTV